ncbi:hypothetical protein BSNK01_18760 [Bacillaceae bacterium]
MKKITRLKTVWDKKINKYFNEICNNNLQVNKKKVINSENTYPSTDLLFFFYINHLIDKEKMFYPRGFLMHKNDSAMMVYYRSVDYKKDSLNEVRQILNIWIERENPSLRGYQVLTRSFILKNMKGRRIIAVLPDSNSLNWSFLLEGGILFPINDSFEEWIAKFNSSQLGKWTIGEVEDIMLNPVYYLGRHYEPYDLFIEWQYVFLYAIASLGIDENDIQKLFRLFQEFLKFIEENICEYIQAKPLIKPIEGIEIFICIISQIKSYLSGAEETGISKNILMLLRSRYCYLPVIFQLISKYFPKKLEERLTCVPFQDRLWSNLLDRLKEIINSYEKGIILEEIATHFIDSIPGLNITGKRKRGNREEVDIYFCNVSMDAVLWEMGPLILVECKNRKKKCTVTDVRNLVPVMETKGIKTAIIFSTSGFTKTALDEVENQYFNGKIILTVELNELREISEKNPPYTFLVKKIKNLMSLYEDDLRLAY